MRQYIDIMEELVYDKYGDQLKVKDDELKVKDIQLKVKDDEINELKECKDAVKELSQLDGLPPKAMSIISNLMVF